MGNRGWWVAAVIAAAPAFFSGCNGDKATQEPTAPVSVGPIPNSPSPIPQYRLALPGRAYRFPQDDAAHPEYATEWWYYTGHLRDGSGRTYGYQLTFFRVGVSGPKAKRRSAWAVRDIYFAHLAVTDEADRTYHYFDRISRGSLGEAGARTDRYDVHIGDWSAALKGNAHVLNAVQDGYGVRISATPVKPPVIHGENGISQKAKGQGRSSYYYSYTRMATRGTLYVSGHPLSVTGISWFDHEFGSNQLAPYQAGWDWFSLQMDNGTEAMLYLMRDTGNTIDPYSSGTLVDAAGHATHLKKDDYSVRVLEHWKSPASGAVYPSKWSVRVPKAGWDVLIQPTVADQELRTTGSVGVTYWEGSVTVAGTVRGRPVHGRGYVELTGYAQAFQQTF